MEAWKLPILPIFRGQAVGVRIGFSVCCHLLPRAAISPSCFLAVFLLHCSLGVAGFPSKSAEGVKQQRPRPTIRQASGNG